MFLKWEERLLYFCRILLSCQAGFLSLWWHQLSLPVGFCHVIIHLPQTTFSRQAGHLSPWRRMILENMGSGTSFPPWPQFVARATSCQAGQVLVKQVRGPVILARQEMLCLARHDSWKLKFAGCSSFCFFFH